MFLGVENFLIHLMIFLNYKPHVQSELDSPSLDFSSIVYN